MSAEEMVQKYTQLNAEDKRQVEELLQKLVAKNVDQAEKKKSLFGILKGKIWMSPDFDEPLEDFKDYM